MTKVVIIAEAGVNHNGNMETAFALIDAAAAAGADIVKFQTFVPEALVAPSAGKAAYQKKTTAGEESQLAMLRRLALPLEAFADLAAHCAAKNIAFMSTPFDGASFDALRSLSMPALKVPSGEITNLPYLRRVAACGLPLLVSTGMSALEEVQAAVGVLYSAGVAAEDITLLHCTTEYPASYEDTNLLALRTMREAFPEVGGIGYSDHTEGIEVALAATALGASVIEKHFTLDRRMEGPDHSASIEPEALAALVAGVRNVSASLGSGVKEPAASELQNRDIARKSIVAARNIHKGELFSEENLTCKRPGTGISPMRWNSFIGTAADRDYAEDELL